MEIAEEKGIRVMMVYMWVRKDLLLIKTPAEYKYFHIIGGDAVGMSDSARGKS